jgi:hypothetical protein
MGSSINPMTDKLKSGMFSIVRLLIFDHARLLILLIGKVSKVGGHYVDPDV